MGNIILNFLTDLLQRWVETIDAVTFENIVHSTFYIEESLGLNGASFDIGVLCEISVNFAVLLIILKFLKKGFDSYIAWTDDPNSDPLVLAVNFTKALAIALCFSVIYGWVTDVAEELTNSMLEAITGQMTVEWADIIVTITNGGLAMVIYLLICVILFVILYIQFIMRGAELFILRVGYPIACVGLLDSNGGVYSGYNQKLFQTVLSVLVQIVLAKLSIGLMAERHMIWAIAFFMTAIKSPQILREFMYQRAGGGGLSQAYYTINMVKGLARK